ncbi:MAG: DUF4143 domain-containing protein [Gammaproteobacteria bacterium]|nr:DUF4143 domain-containing protein [Gammaproteobacteria bacterium]
MDDVTEKRRFLAAMLPSADQFSVLQIAGPRQTGKTQFTKYFGIPEKASHVTESHVIYELFSLSLAELMSDKKNPLRFPLFDRLLQRHSFENILSTAPAILLKQEENQRKMAQEHMLAYGGFPALLHLTENKRLKWLKYYEDNYIDHFAVAKLIHSASLLNYSELARGADISVDSARRYIADLREQYQIELLKPFHRNLTSRVVKTPKIYWLDVGVARIISGLHEKLNPALYETFVVSEIVKWIRTSKRSANYYFYRTRSGLEVDVLLELPHGIIGIEIQSRETIFSKDITPLKELAANLKSEWLGGLIIYNGSEIKKMAEPNIWALPSWRLFT